jgi:metal-responsive CopG/Arc/MetJ family transcriptional regulator
MAADAPPSVRLTVTLPAPLVEAFDRSLVKGGSRSAAVREALEKAVAEAQEREQIEAWIRGYEQYPETEEEFGWADAVALEFFAEHPAP